MESIRVLVAHMFSLWVLHGSSSFKLYILRAAQILKALWYDIYLCIPGTQITFVFNGLLLEGSNPEIEDKQVPGMYIYIYTHDYTVQKYIYTHVEAWFSFGWIYRDLTWFAAKKPLTAFFSDESPIRWTSQGTDPKRCHCNCASGTSTIFTGVVGGTLSRGHPQKVGRKVLRESGPQKVGRKIQIKDFLYFLHFFVELPRYCWWFRNPAKTHRLDVEKPCK